MGLKLNNGEKLILLGLGAIGLYYLTAGIGRENNAALLPDSIENRIDRLVAKLNAQVGEDWGNRSLDTLKFLLQRVLPSHLVALVDVVYAVEQQAKWVQMNSNAKRQRAVEIANVRRLS